MICAKDWARHALLRVSPSLCHPTSLFPPFWKRRERKTKKPIIDFFSHLSSTYFCLTNISPFAFAFSFFRRYVDIAWMPCSFAMYWSLKSNFIMVSKIMGFSVVSPCISLRSTMLSQALWESSPRHSWFWLLDYEALAYKHSASTRGFLLQ